MTSFFIKLAYFVETDIGYQPSKFQCSKMSGSNFMEGGWKKTRPQYYNEIRKPSACRVKVAVRTEILPRDFLQNPGN